MDDDFDYAFEDELDALREMEEEAGGQPNFGNTSRKSLSFSTPAAKKVSAKASGSEKANTSNAGLDESGLEPLEDSVTEENEPNKGKKRTKDQMFGSLSDSEDEELFAADILPDIVHRAKRAKTNGSSAPTPIQGQAPSGVSDAHQEYVDRLTLNYDHERVRVLRRIPDCPFVGVTGGMEGKRFYLKLKPDPAEKPPTGMKTSMEHIRLLGTPLAVLKMQVEEQVSKRREDEDHRIASALAQEDDKENAPQEHSLWVEKYSPKQYTDLLSDESTNRTLLKWLKLWDGVVFGKDTVKSKAKAKGKDKPADDKFKKFKGKLPEVTDELDEHNRPLHKVVLLHGPPGLGKTTLGHIVARHCGYNVVEINASDDRSVELFKTKIEAATQMKAVLGPDPRPNCLIIDEIDGAPQPAINLLISLIKGELGASKKKKKQPTVLLRPIICICNDLYVPALRQLRSLALVMNFSPTAPSQLASRLMEVAREEHMKSDLTTLMALCEKTDNDIRSCLNTMQFIRSQGKEITLRAVQSLSVGQKDAHKSLFSAWSQVFQMPKPQRKRYVNPYDRGTSVGEIEQMNNLANQNNTSMSARFQTILQVAYAAGDQEKMQQGLFENYLQAKVKDPRMDGLLYGLEWFCYVDSINKQIMHSQNYSIGVYTPYLPVAFHFVFSSNHPSRLQYPHSQFEFRTKHSKNQNLVTSMLEDMAPSVRKNVNQLIAVMDLVPNLMDIIAPTLRPVNTQLYSKREKDELKQLIKVMIAYNITYQQQRTLDGQYNYVLDPCVDEVVRFVGQKPQRQLTYAAKQLIAREIELEKMRGSEASSEQRGRPAPSVGKSGNTVKVETQAVPNHLRQTLEPKAITSQHEDKVDVDFFGRAVIKEDKPSSKEKKKEVISGDIWFHFKEGFTNAVRKTIRIQDLL